MLTCSSKIEHFSSDVVTIRVTGRDFRLPKDLLCYNSTYFNQTLNKSEQSTKLQNGVIELPNVSLETFELVVQWMYMSDIVLPSYWQIQRQAKGEETQKKNGKEVSKPRNTSVDLTGSGLTTTPAELEQHFLSHMVAITSYIRFFLVAYKIGLLGPFDNVVSKVKSVICSEIRSLINVHIRMAFKELPRGHPVRKLFAQACVRSYMEHIDIRPHRKEFRFRFEMTEIEGFAADLLYAVNETMRKRVAGEGNVYTDPLLGTQIKLHL